MAWGEVALRFGDLALGEVTLFAAVGLLVGGLDDLLVDAIWIGRACWRGAVVRMRFGRASLADFPLRPDGGRIAVFVPAWDEAGVVGAMLDTALGRLDHADYRIYVGVYPNDAATRAEVAGVAARDGRVRMVVNVRTGPTTKADCLNSLWRALGRDEAREGAVAKAVVLHDAEDVVHAGELRVFDRLVERFAVVQIPVRPLVHRGSRWVSGHYLDEFAEAHAKQLVVREALGAALPLAGTGCAIARPMLDRIADARGGRPFDPASLTEDYELGLHIGALGGRGIIAHVPEVPGGPPVAVSALFPGTLDDAVRQKARWIQGIALAGWDRTGWGGRAGLREWWMRLRDRRALVAVLVLAAGYAALAGWALSWGAHRLMGTPAIAPHGPLRLLLGVNAMLLGWRLAMRAYFVAAMHGPGEALRSVPRALVANVIAMLAARRALVRYCAMLRGEALRWDKTRHSFPDLTA